MKRIILGGFNTGKEAEIANELESIRLRYKFV